MNGVLRAGVVGVGHLGRHHARILGSMEGVQLTSVVDVDQARAQEIAASSGGTVYASAADILDKVDLVSIATPTESHLDVARLLLGRGIPVLVEKPLARSLAEADELVRLAGQAGVVLAVGHTERFNPAVMAAAPHVREPRFIEVHRLGTFPERSLDIDVVFDLMIHDLDLVLAFANSPVAHIEAVGVPVLTGRVDIANARLRFESGCVANITASRISRDRTRKIRFFQRDAYISIDCGSKEAEMYRLVPVAGARPAIQGGALEVRDAEPLRSELEDFVSAVRERRPARVDGHAGRNAVELAQQITAKMAEATQS